MDFNEKIKTEIIPFLCEVRDKEVAHIIQVVDDISQFVFVSDKMKEIVYYSTKVVNKIQYTISDYCEYVGIDFQGIEPELGLKYHNAQKKFSDIENRKPPYICSIILTIYQNMKKLFFLTLLAIPFAQCTKEVEQPKEPCEVFNTGKGKVVNLQPDPYLVYLDGKYIGRCEKNSTFEHDIKPSTYSFKAVQQSGYLIYPSEYVSSYNVKQCETTTVTLK
jgi:hypothetical protein